MTRPKEGEQPSRQKPTKSGEEVFGSEAAYARFLPIATMLDADEIIPMRADASLAYHNVTRGLSEVMKFEDHIEEHLPKVDLDELKSLPDLALGVVFASFKANLEGGANDTRALLA